MRVLTIAAAAAVVLVLSACGDDENRGATDFVPAAGEATPPDTTPGVPEGASYDLNGNEWLKLNGDERLTAAEDYVADHPDECTTGDDRSAAGDPVRRWVDGSVGTDFPL